MPYFVPNEQVQVLFFSATFTQPTIKFAKALDKEHRGTDADTFTLRGGPGEFAFSKDVAHHYINVGSNLSSKRLKVLGDFSRQLSGIPFIVFVSVRHVNASHGPLCLWFCAAV